MADDAGLQNMGSLFDDIEVLADSTSTADEKSSAKKFEIVIEKIELNDALAQDKTRFNTNNIWTDNKKPVDYADVSAKTKTKVWVDKFHKSYYVINLPIESWMKDAFTFGTMTARVSKLHDDDIEEYVQRIETEEMKELLCKKVFIRSEDVSLKRGVHGIGPYSSLKQIVQSLVTTDTGHSVLTDEVFKEKTLKIYILPWINMIDHQEFRVFVKDKRINAISQQALYSKNTILQDLNDSERKEVITKWVDTITHYYYNTISDKLTESTDYCIDISILDNGKPYFIEINPFGQEYSSGSSLFGWVQDHHILYGKDNDANTVYFRYVV